MDVFERASLWVFTTHLIHFSVNDWKKKGVFKKAVTFRRCWNDLSSLNSKLSNDGTETRSKLNYSTIGFVTFTRSDDLKDISTRVKWVFFEGLQHISRCNYFFFCSSLMASLQGISDVKTMPFETEWLAGCLFSNSWGLLTGNRSCWLTGLQGLCSLADGLPWLAALPAVLTGWLLKGPNNSGWRITMAPRQGALNL